MIYANQKSLLLSRIWKKFLVQLSAVLVLFALLFALLMMMVETKLEKNSINQRTHAQAELIIQTLLEYILIEDSVGLLQRSVSLTEAMPELLALQVFNESKQLLAKSKKVLSKPIASEFIVELERSVEHHGEVFGFLRISRNTQNDLLELRDQFFLMQWFYIVIVIVLLLYCIGSVYYRTRSILLGAQFQALHDPMTNLPNRRMLHEFKNREYRRAAREKYSIAIILVDIDDFKEFNDLYGHSEGDEVIKRVASVLSTSLNRASDIAVRYGGEEFLMLCVCDESGCRNIAERCRESVRELAIPHEKSETSPYVTISVGYVVLSPESLPPKENPIHKADLALYKAKKTGKNCSVSFCDVTSVENVTLLKSTKK